MDEQVVLTEGERGLLASLELSSPFGGLDGDQGVRAAGLHIVVTTGLPPG
jgi:hypothetical protein